MRRKDREVADFKTIKYILETGKSFEFTEEMTSNVAVIRIVCTSFTAKHRAMPV